MEISEPHPWDVAADEARRIQYRLRRQVDLTDGLMPDRITLVAGVDNGYVRDGEHTIAHAAVVVLRLPSLEIETTAFATARAAFPYMPGLLSFREAPAILAALRGLSVEPEVFLFDGHGIAHPRRLGIATHLGVVLGRPTIGCAKSRLIGRYEEPAREFGAQTPLIDAGEVIGAAVRTRPGHAPLFVSPGHRVSLATALAVVLACCREGRFLPEPTRLAHDLVTERAREHRRRLAVTAADSAGPGRG
jgi:deoxyribonuclease V